MFLIVISVVFQGGSPSLSQGIRECESGRAFDAGVNHGRAVVEGWRGGLQEEEHESGLQTRELSVGGFRGCFDRSICAFNEADSALFRGECLRFFHPEAKYIILVLSLQK